jgi:hypothetical protein
VLLLAAGSRQRGNRPRPGLPPGGTLPARKLAGVPVPPRRAIPGRPAACRAAAAIAGAVLLTAAVGGCAKFDAALGKQWAIVNFRPGTSVATLLKVRTACSHVPNARPEALPSRRKGPGMIYSVQFRTDNASDANLAQLQQCLQKFPAVAGIDFEDTGDS